MHIFSIFIFIDSFIHNEKTFPSLHFTILKSNRFVLFEHIKKMSFNCVNQKSQPTIYSKHFKSVIFICSFTFFPWSLKCDRYSSVSYEYFFYYNHSMDGYYEHCCTMHTVHGSKGHSFTWSIGNMLQMNVLLVISHSVCHPHWLFHVLHANGDSLDASSVRLRSTYNSGQFPFQWDDNNRMNRIIAKLD